MFNTGVDILQTRKTAFNRNRRIEICVFRNPISTGRGREMETDCLSFENDDTGRMQLRRTQQRTISSGSSTQGMEEIRQRKPTTSQSPDGPQKPGTFYDHKGTHGQTDTMDGNTLRIRLQNRISTRQGRRKTGCAHKEEARHANGKRRTHQTERKDLTTKGKIFRADSGTGIGNLGRK